MKKYIVILLSVSLITGCATKSSEVTNEVKVTENQTSKAIESTSVQFKSKGIQTIYGAYEKLRDALVATDYETAKAYAGQLKDALQSDDKTMMQASIVDGIVNAGEIEAARAVFSELNESMESIFEGAVTSGKLNKCFCPMALDNNGASWFSSSDEIMNPYFGDKMLKCGTIKKTIQ